MDISLSLLHVSQSLLLLTLFEGPIDGGVPVAPSSGCADTQHQREDEQSVADLVDVLDDLVGDLLDGLLVVAVLVLLVDGVFSPGAHGRLVEHQDEGADEHCCEHYEFDQDVAAQEVDALS